MGSSNSTPESESKVEDDVVGPEKANRNRPLLKLEPSDIITFVGFRNSIMKSRLILDNISNENIRFKIQTDEPGVFQSQPNFGRIERGEKLTVTVNLKPYRSRNPEGTIAVKCFVMVVPTESSTASGTSWWTSPDVQEFNLGCVYALPQERSRENNSNSQEQMDSPDETETPNSGEAPQPNPPTQVPTKSLSNPTKMEEANSLYKTAQTPSGVSRVLKRSYLEKAIRIYREELHKEIRVEAKASILRNIGMSNFRLADVVDSLDAKTELKLVTYHLSVAIENFIQAINWRPQSMGTEWGKIIVERIMDSFELGFRLAVNRDVGNERFRSAELDKLFQGIPDTIAFKSLKASCYLAKANFFYRRSIVAQEMSDFRAAIQFLEYSNEETQMAIKYAGTTDSALWAEIRVMEVEIASTRCSCESIRMRHQADTFLEEELSQDGMSIGMMWTILDMYKEAVLLTRDYDIENEAIALSRMGKMFDKILKMRVKAHESYRAAFDLAQTLLPRDLNNYTWFKDTKEALERFQRNIVLEEQQREEAEKAPILKKLEPELKILQTIANFELYSVVGAQKLLKHIYEKHPPKTPYTFDPSKLDRVATHAALKEAIVNYHPDRQAVFGIEWKVLCGEITKYLTQRYEHFK